MNDDKDKESEVKNETTLSKIKSVLVSIFAVIGAIFSGIISYFFIRRSNVSDIGDRIDDTREQLGDVSGELSQAGVNIQRIEDSINTQLTGLERVEGRIGHSEELISELGTEISKQQKRCLPAANPKFILHIQKVCYIC